MFRNLTLFRFSPAVGELLADLGGLEAALTSRQLRDCGPLELLTRGFISPFGSDNPLLTLSINGTVFFTVGQQEKLLPTAVLNAALAEKLREEQSAGRHVGARARKRLKAELLDQMLPRAFIRPSRLHGYLDAANGWLVLDTASRKAAEAVISELRHALGSFPALPLAPDNSPRQFMTQRLLSGELPDGFEFGDECELRDPAGGAVAKCSRQEMESREVKEHLRNGKQVFRLGLGYRDRLAFTLDESLVIRKLRLLGIAMDSLGEYEDAETEISARMALMAGEIAPLLHAIETIFQASRPEN